MMGVLRGKLVSDLISTSLQRGGAGSYRNLIEPFQRLRGQTVETVAATR